jgi:hypothetical protein
MEKGAVMGLKITGPDKGKIPRLISLVLSCDGDHGLLEPPTVRYDDQGDGYIGMHDRAIAAGWSETSERVLCPQCRRGGKGGQSDD